MSKLKKNIASRDFSFLLEIIFCIIVMAIGIVLVLTNPPGLLESLGVIMTASMFFCLIALFGASE